MRLRSDVWVAALVRRAFAGDAHAAIVHRGIAEAGAIFVAVDRLDGTADLWGPAPQADYSDRPGQDRGFERLLGRVDRPVIAERIAKERRFDTDLWVVEVEDRQGRHFIEPPPEDPDAPARERPQWPPRP